MLKENWQEVIKKTLNTREILDLWQEYCKYSNSMDDIVYDIDDIKDLLDVPFPQIISHHLVDFDNFNPYDDWMYNTPHGYVTTDNIYDIVVLSAMKNWLEEYHNSSLGIYVD